METTNDKIPPEDEEKNLLKKSGEEETATETDIDIEDLPESKPFKLMVPIFYENSYAPPLETEIPETSFLLDELLQCVGIENMSIKSLVKVMFSDTFGSKKEFTLALAVSSSIWCVKQLLQTGIFFDTGVSSPYLNQIKHYINVLNYYEEVNPALAKDFFERCVYCYKCEHSWISEYYCKTTSPQKLQFFMERNLVKFNTNMDTRGVNWEVVSKYISYFDLPMVVYLSVVQQGSKEQGQVDLYLASYIKNSPQLLKTMFGISPRPPGLQVFFDVCFSYFDDWSDLPLYEEVLGGESKDSLIQLYSTGQYKKILDLYELYISRNIVFYDIPEIEEDNLYNFFTEEGGRDKVSRIMESDNMLL